jgi:hypothetical protein
MVKVAVVAREEEARHLCVISYLHVRSSICSKASPYISISLASNNGCFFLLVCVTYAG